MITGIRARSQTRGSRVLRRCRPFSLIRPPASAHERSGALHIIGDLSGQGLGRVEASLVAKAFPELERDGLAAEITFEVQEEGLGVKLLAAECRVRADVDRRN